MYRDDAERQGAYGLLESTDVAAEAVAKAVFTATARACREEDFVFCAVDGSSVTLTDHQRAKGFGPIGTRGQGARGLKVMNALAISAKGVPLGLTAQEWWIRQDVVPVGQGKKDRDKRKVSDKETQRWLDEACRVEENQLQSPEAVKKWATILAAVAVRVERIKLLSRREPERPATDEFSPLELRALVLLRFGKPGKAKLAHGAVPTLGEATTWLAQIGGYTGKSSGGPPGSVVLARGLETLAVAVRYLGSHGADL